MRGATAARAASSSTSIRRHRARRSRPPSTSRRGGGRYVEGAVMTAVPPHRIKVPLLAGRPARRGRSCRTLNELGLRGAGRERRARRRERHEDVPQRDGQGAGGDGDRELHRGPPLRRRGGGDRVAARDVPRRRLGAAGRVLLPAGHRAWPPPRRGDARGGRHRARGRPRARGARPAPPSARPGWPISADAGLFGKKRGSAELARSPDWRVEADRILDHVAERRRRSD